MGGRNVRGIFAVVLVAVLAVCTAPRAFAAAPTGACCLANGACVDALDFQCAAQNGDFIGAGTSCASVACAAPLAVPMLSIGGLVAALGALGSLGAYRLARRRRR